MHYPILLAIVLTAFGCKNKKNVSSNSEDLLVTIKITRTGVYCGGARPTDEMLDKIRSQNPFPGKPIFIREGTENDVSKKIIISGTTDENGIVTVKLSPGTYAIVDYEKQDKKQYELYLEQFEKPPMYYEPMDKACLAKWLRTPDGVITVAQGAKNEFHINYSDKCSWHRIPCAQYNGPLPP